MKKYKTDIIFSSIVNGWQVCPKCLGQGVVWFPPNQPMNETFSGNGEPFKCDLCNGKKIISERTGLPPV